jgi:hypothetical protein
LTKACGLAGTAIQRPLDKLVPGDASNILTEEGKGRLAEAECDLALKADFEAVSAILGFAASWVGSHFAPKVSNTYRPKGHSGPIQHRPFGMGLTCCCDGSIWNHMNSLYSVFAVGAQRAATQCPGTSTMWLCKVVGKTFELQESILTTPEPHWSSFLLTLPLPSTYALWRPFGIFLNIYTKGIGWVRLGVGKGARLVSAAAEVEFSACGQVLGLRARMIGGCCLCEAGGGGTQSRSAARLCMKNAVRFAVLD